MHAPQHTSCASGAASLAASGDLQTRWCFNRVKTPNGVVRSFVAGLAAWNQAPRGQPGALAPFMQLPLVRYQAESPVEHMLPFLHDARGNMMRGTCCPSHHEEIDAVRFLSQAMVLHQSSIT